MTTPRGAPADPLGSVTAASPPHGIKRRWRPSTPSLPFEPRSFVAGLVAATVALGAAALATPADPHRGHAAAPSSLRSIEAGRDFESRMAAAEAAMHHAMAAAPRTGDPDHDFASAMVPHHQGAIEMGRIELLHGRDPVLRRLAQEIVVSQGQEIVVLQRRLAALAPASAPTPSRRTP
jgi:hypothetical protein